MSTTPTADAPLGTGSGRGAVPTIASGGLVLRLDRGGAFDVREFSVSERMSGLFTVTLVAVTRDADVDFETTVGREASFAVLGERARRWEGICTELCQIAVDETGLSTYRITIAPRLWLATQRRNYRVFQQMSELDVALRLLGEWGVEPSVELDPGRYKTREYRVQYGESDFAFISRMLEDAGISYRFAPADGERSTLVLTDEPQRAEARPPLPFCDNPTDAPREHVTALTIERRVRPGTYTVRDHDHRLPADYPLVASASADVSEIEEPLERFHYAPGAFLFGTDKGDDTPVADDHGKSRSDEAEAEALVRKRLEARRAGAKTFTFETTALDLAPGSVLSILDHPHRDLGAGRRLLVVESRLRGTFAGDRTHSCEAVPADLPHRPPLVTPKPKAGGVESATVVGPTGEEIHCDEFGRVRLHFHWDRGSRMDEWSSCWVPVSQSWAGAGFGSVHLPRVGQEVIVDFLGGDPDRPVVTGRVFTNAQKVPYALPAHKTQSGIKTSSTGGTGGYNELMFEDAAGRELVRVQAERDLEKLVKHDERQTVGNDRVRSVGHNEEITVGGDRGELLGGDLRQSIGLNSVAFVGGNRTTQIGLEDATLAGRRVTVAVGGAAGGTSTTMESGRIVLTTGAGATITLEGDTITLEASNVYLYARDFLGAASMNRAAVGGSTGLTIGSPGGDVGVHGGPMVKLNPQ